MIIQYSPFITMFGVHRDVSCYKYARVVMLKLLNDLHGIVN